MDDPDGCAGNDWVAADGGGAAFVPAANDRGIRRHAWWRSLPEHYYDFDGDEFTEVDEIHRWKVRGSAAADRLVRTGLASVVAMALLPTLATSARLQRERERLRLYGELADRGDVDAVFARPPAGLKVSARSPRGPEWQPPRAVVRQLRFESPFEPLHPDLRAAWRNQRRNRFAHAQHWRHPNGPRKTLVFVHGFLIYPYWLNGLGFSLPWLYKKGYDILLVTLPFHGARREQRHPLSGLGFMAGGLSHINEAMLQSVLDLRCWIDYLFAEGAPEVGVSGMSLGGYLAALLAAVEPRLSFCIPNSPVVAPIDMALEWQPMRQLFRTVVWRDRVRVSELRHGMALHSPLTWAPRVDTRRLMIIGGAGDRITPPRFLQLLHRHWHGSRLHWFPGNHLVHLHQAGYLREMKRFMDECHSRKR